MKLKVYQVVGLHALYILLYYKDRSAVLADDVGTSKTILLLALLYLINRKKGLEL
jgi:SNF2 family DNA or RNA helicase